MLILNSYKALYLPKIILIILLSCLCDLAASAQVSNAEIRLLKRLDSIQGSASVARHFGALYFSTTEKAVQYFLDKDPADKALIRRFETRFADLYFNASGAFQRGDTVPATWKNYFSDTGYSPLAYKFYGLNAHINGDIWKAMVAEFSMRELVQLKKPYADFQHSLEKQYVEFYREAYTSNDKIKRTNIYTLGLGRFLGKLWLKKWRTRQYRLAVMYYKDPVRFQTMLKTTEQKKEHIDHLIAKYLTPGFAIFGTSK